MTTFSNISMSSLTDKNLLLPLHPVWYLVILSLVLRLVEELDHYGLTRSITATELLTLFRIRQIYRNDRGGLNVENEKFQELMLEQFAKLTNQIQEVNTKLSGQVQEIDTKLSGQIQEVNTKLSGQVQEIDTKLSRQIQEVNTKLSGQIQEVKGIQLRMENSLTEKAKGLYEFVAIQRDANKDMVERLDRIEAKVEVLQLETAHIRRVK